GDRALAARPRHPADEDQVADLEARAGGTRDAHDLVDRCEVVRLLHRIGRARAADPAVGLEVRREKLAGARGPARERRELVLPREDARRIAEAGADADAPGI